MKNIFKGLVFGFLALALVVGMGAGSANADTTFATNAITESGALTVTTAVGSALNLGTTTTTGAISIGTSVTTGNITVGGAQTSGTLSLGGGVQTGTITLGGGTGAQILNIGTGATGVKTINIGTSAIGNIITIGTETAAASLELMYGTGALKVSPTPNTTVVQDELSFHVVPIAGGAATEAETFTGLRTTAVVVCSANALTNAVTLNKSAITADTITFTFSADPGASSLSCMIHNI